MAGRKTKPADRQKSKEVLLTFIIIAVLFASINLRRWLVWLGFDFLNQGSPTAQLLIGYLFWVVPTLLTLLIIDHFDFDRVLQELGFKANAWKGVLFAFIATLPMMAGYFFAAQIVNFDASLFFKNAFLPGVFEEYIFRGFLIGQLFKRGRLGFIPAVLIGAAAFAFTNLYQGGALSQTFGILLINLISGLWFAWLYFEWGRNLYLVMTLHIFMVLWGSLFSAAKNAPGISSANAFSLLTIAITIVATIIAARRTNFKIKGRDWLFSPRG